MTAIRTIIFDMDGTLIDTEKYYRVFWKQAAAEYGYAMTDEQALALRSLGRPFAPRLLAEWFGEKFDYEAVRKRRKELMDICLRQEGIGLKAGALVLLSYCRENHIRTAIATAGELERANRSLEQAGLAGYFDKIISAAMVKEGKPSPDIYLYACEQLGEAPENCYAVEDSPNGVQSAFRAGCRVIMVPDLSEPDERLMGCLFARVDSLEEIVHFL